MIQFEGKTPRRPRFDRVEIEAALRERPGEWATIDEGPSNVMGAYASKWRGTSGRRFEWAVSSLGYGTGRTALMGRYLGEPETY